MWGVTVFEFNIGEMNRKIEGVFEEEIKEEAKKYFIQLFNNEDEVDSSLSGFIPTLRAFRTLYGYFENFERPFELIKSALYLYRKALRIDYNTTTDILVEAAEDMDKALNQHWQFCGNLREWAESLEKDIPVRDKVYDYFNLIHSLLEGIFKREIWFLISCFQISNNKNNSASQWRNKSLGAIVKKLGELPEPLNSFFSCRTVKEIPINQLRNIAAHKDFTVYNDKIEVTIGIKNKRSFLLTFEELTETMMELLKIRMVAKTFINFVLCENFETLLDKGYKYMLIPETLINDVSLHLANEDIILEKVQKVGDTIEIKCKCDTKPDKNVFEVILRYVRVFNIMFDDIYSSNIDYEQDIIVEFNNNKCLRLYLNKEKIKEIIQSIKEIGLCITRCTKSESHN